MAPGGVGCWRQEVEPPEIQESHSLIPPSPICPYEGTRIYPWAATGLTLSTETSPPVVAYKNISPKKPEYRAKEPSERTC